jgi:hypothetical protein
MGALASGGLGLAVDGGPSGAVVDGRPSGVAVDGGPGGAALVCSFELGFWLYPHPLSKRAVLVGMLREANRSS